MIVHDKNLCDYTKFLEMYLSLSSFPIMQKLREERFGLSASDSMGSKHRLLYVYGSKHAGICN